MAAEDYQLLAFISQPESILRSGFLGQRAKCSAAPIRKSIPYPPFWRLVHRLAYNGDVAAGQLAVFLRCSLDPYEFGYGRFARALPAVHFERNDVIIICETVHYPSPA